MAEPTAAKLSPAPHLENGLIDVTPTGKYIAITNMNAKTSPLLRLPAELRAKIWQYTLDGHIIRPHAHEITHKLLTYLEVELSRPNINSFSLLHACRQIYTEIAILPYVLSTFFTMGHTQLSMWTKSMSPHEVALVGNIRKLRLQSTFSLEPEVLIGTFPALKKLELYRDKDISGTMDDKKSDGYERLQGVAIELTYSSLCDSLTQWASGDLNAKCSLCIALEALQKAVGE